MVRLIDSRGRQVHISMWDALMPGVGKPVKRSVPVQTAGEAPKTAGADKDKKKDDKKEEKKDDKKSDKKEGSKSGAGTTPAADKGGDKGKPQAAKESEWTAEMDKQLVELKEGEKSWKEIGDIMKLEKKQLTERYGTLMKDKKGAGGGGGTAKSPDAKLVLSAYQQLLADMPGVFVTDGAPYDMPTAAPALTAVVEAAKQQPRRDMGWECRTAVAVPDDIFRAGEPGPLYDFAHDGDKVKLTMQEILFLGRMSDYLDEQKWLLLASRFWDRTHKQVSPHTLRRLLAGEAGKA